MTARYAYLHLRNFVAERLGMSGMPLISDRVPFESRSLHERHYLLLFTCWLLVDLHERLSEAWHVGAVRYNMLLKDFDSPSEFYAQIVEQFANWRDRFG